MVNGTFTFKNAHNRSGQYSNPQKWFNEIAEELKSKWGVQTYFCEIFGNRWSFFAGDQTLDIPLHRIRLNEHYGMITGEIPCPVYVWQETVEQIKKFAPA